MIARSNIARLRRMHDPAVLLLALLNLTARLRGIVLGSCNADMIILAQIDNAENGTA